jgi:hypothetical protein
MPKQSRIPGLTPTKFSATDAQAIPNPGSDPNEVLGQAIPNPGSDPNEVLGADPNEVLGDRQDETCLQPPTLKSTANRQRRTKLLPHFLPPPVYMLCPSCFPPSICSVPSVSGRLMPSTLFFACSANPQTWPFLFSQTCLNQVYAPLRSEDLQTLPSPTLQSG